MQASDLYHSLSLAPRSYTALQDGDTSHLYSALALKVVGQLLNQTSPYLPPHVYLNVNFPLPSKACPSAEDYKFVLATAFSPPRSPGMSCGTTRIPVEATVLAAGCHVSIAAMTATPKLRLKRDVSLDLQRQVAGRLGPLLTCFESHKMAGKKPLDEVALSEELADETVLWE